MSQIDEENNVLNKRAIVVVALPIALVAIFLTLFFTVFNRDESEEAKVEEIKSEISVSSSDQIALEGLAEQLITQAGTFGVKQETITPNNIDEMATLLETNVEVAEYYFTPRSVAYNSIGGLILEGSPIDYNDTETSQWSNDFETNFRNSFTIKSVEATSEDKSAFVTVDGEQVEVVNVRVVFNSNETMYVENGSEYGALRTYSVRSKDFNNNSATLMFAKDNEGEWKLYDVRNLSNEFLLSTWNDPKSDSFSETQFNFPEIDKITPPDQNVEEIPTDEE